jgi:hypothetical protein
MHDAGRRARTRGRLGIAHDTALRAVAVNPPRLGALGVQVLPLQTV